MELKFKQDKGVAGLTIFLSLIVMIFIIGLLIMIFTIMGSKMRDATYTATEGSVAMESVDATSFTNGTGYTLAKSATELNFRSPVIVAVYNNTNELLGSGNYTLVGNLLKNATAIAGATNVKVNYTYTYSTDNLATNVMNDTYNSVGGATSWFNIFIVIGAMVVLILLTVIIITAIRSSGLVAGAGSTRDVGTA